MAGLYELPAVALDADHGAGGSHLARHGATELAETAPQIENPVAGREPHGPQGGGVQETVEQAQPLLLFGVGAVNVVRAHGDTFLGDDGPTVLYYGFGRRWFKIGAAEDEGPASLQPVHAQRDGVDPDPREYREGGNQNRPPSPITRKRQKRRQAHQRIGGHGS